MEVILLVGLAGMTIFSVWLNSGARLGDKYDEHHNKEKK